MSRVGSWFPQGMWTVRLDDETRRRRLQKEIQADPNLKRAQRRLDYKQEVQEGIQSGEISQYDIEQGAAVDLDAIRTISSEQEAAQSLTTRALGSIPEKSTSRLEVPEGAFDPERLKKIFGDSRLNIPSEGGEDLVNVINESLTKRLQNKARGNTLTSTGSVGGKGSIANNAQRLLERQGAGVNQASKAASKAVEAAREIPSLEGLEVPEGAFDPERLEKIFGTGADKAADAKNIAKGPSISTPIPGVSVGAQGLAFDPITAIAQLVLAYDKYNKAKEGLHKDVSSTYRSGFAKKDYPYYDGR